MNRDELTESTREARINQRASMSAGAQSIGASGVGAIAVGALAIGPLVVGHAKIRRREIGELVVDRLRLTDSIQTP